MTIALSLAAAVLLLVLVYRKVGWIRGEPTMAEQLRGSAVLLAATATPGYRRTYPKDHWKLRIARRAERKRCA